jgi:hypothetical protein
MNADVTILRSFLSLGSSFVRISAIIFDVWT